MQRIFIFIFLLLLFSKSFSQGSLNEEVVYIPKKNIFGDILLETTLFKPKGNGPFPLAIINHGSGSGDPKNQPRYRPLSAVRYFLERNYAVLVPMRPGFSKSEGTYYDGGCSIESNGVMQAETIPSIIDYAHTLPYINNQLTVIVGQSHGGWTALAYGANNPDPSVKGLINFSGGYKNSKCAGWRSGLISASEHFGNQTQIPSLWIYGDNDSFFPKVLYQSMYKAYVAGNPRATLFAYGNFGFDSHRFFINSDSRKTWTAPVDNFLMSVDLPYKAVNSGYENPPRMPHPQKTDFANISDSEKVPYLSESGRRAYRSFLSTNDNKAFAINELGDYGWEYGTDDPLTGAIQVCSDRHKKTCKLYAVNDDVVWK
jgi:dienelactone hydrolase